MYPLKPLPTSKKTFPFLELMNLVVAGSVGIPQPYFLSEAKALCSASSVVSYYSLAILAKYFVINFKNFRHVTLNVPRIRLCNYILLFLQKDSTVSLDFTLLSSLFNMLFHTVNNFKTNALVHSL